MPDASLVAAVRNGERDAFEAIFDRYHRRILSYCRHMLGSREDGEDATQHVFVVGYRGLVESSREIELRPWLFAIARNRCLDMLRARRTTASLDAIADEPRALQGLPEVVQRREDLRALVEDIGALPQDQREALVLFELGGLSQRKLAEVLDRRPEQVKALVYQARASLMADRSAREADCDAVRTQLACAKGHDFLRGSIRRHVRVCSACRAFADDARRQRAALALALPVLPTAGLKASTLAAAGAAGAAGAGSGAGVAGGLAGILGKTAALKALGVLVLAGAVGGVGFAVVHRATVAAPAAAKATHHAPANGIPPILPARDESNVPPVAHKSVARHSRAGTVRQSVARHRVRSRAVIAHQRHRARSTKARPPARTHGTRRQLPAPAAGAAPAPIASATPSVDQSSGTFAEHRGHGRHRHRPHPAPPFAGVDQASTQPGYGAASSGQSDSMQGRGRGLHLGWQHQQS